MELIRHYPVVYAQEGSRRGRFRAPNEENGGRSNGTQKCKEDESTALAKVATKGMEELADERPTKQARPTSSKACQAKVGETRQLLHQRRECG